jgi:hypothetical protein
MPAVLRLGVRGRHPHFRPPSAVSDSQPEYLPTLWFPLRRRFSPGCLDPRRYGTGVGFSRGVFPCNAQSLRQLPYEPLDLALRPGNTRVGQRASVSVHDLPVVRQTSPLGIHLAFAFNRPSDDDFAL